MKAFVPPKALRVVTLFPNSKAAGLNRIAFALMGRAPAGRSLRLHMLAFRRSHDYPLRRKRP